MINKRNFRVLLFVFILLTNTSLVVSQNWTQTSSGGETGVFNFPMNIDKNNNIYCGIPYQTTVFISDTSFSHLGFSSHSNLAIPIYSPDGDLIKAITVKSIPNGIIYNPYLVTDDSLNIYIAADFGKRVFIQDTSISQGMGPYPGMPDIFLVKLNKQYEVVWTRIVNATTQDICRGLTISKQGDLYLAVEHVNQGLVNFLGQDTVEFENDQNTILKIDTDGQLIWHKDLKSPSRGMYSRNLILDEKGNIMYIGYVKDDLIVDNDTLFYQGDQSINYYNNFLLEFDPDGNFVHGKIIERSLVFDSFNNAPNDELFFSGGHNYGSILFGEDTLVGHDDSLTRIIGRMDRDFNPIWYHKVKAPHANTLSSFKIDYNSDSLYFVLVSKGIVNLLGNEYDFGNKNSSLFSSFDENGNMGSSSMIRSEDGNYTYGVLVDNCNDVYLAGGFAGELFIGNDTILPFNQNSLGYLTKYIRSDELLLDIGNDTAIGLTSYIDISAPLGYDGYVWSTGETNSSIHLLGSELGVGDHVAFCTVYRGSCFVTDSINISVFDNTGISENSSLITNLFPNPFSSSTTFEYYLSEPSLSHLIIYNHIGEIVEEFTANQSNGKQHIIWDAHKQASGIYYYKLLTQEGASGGKLLLIR
jgi:hypothetical protein